MSKLHLLTIAEEINEMPSIRQILRLNHRYESGCPCLGCQFDLAIEEASTQNLSKLSKAAAALGRKGGQSNSARKRKSSAKNGKLGGRPKLERNPEESNRRLLRMWAMLRERSKGL